MTKQYIAIVALFVAVLFLIISNGANWASEADQETTTLTVGHETDRLFREMGIIRVPHIGSPVDFSLSDVNSKQFTLSDFKGKIVFLNFWTTWCPSCRVEMPHMEKLNRRFKNKDFAMIAVNLQESPLRVKKFIDDHRLTFTVLLDKKGEVGPRFGVRAIPVTYILDRDGSIIGKAFGSRRWASEKSMDLFEHLINDKSVHKE